MRSYFLVPLILVLVAAQEDYNYNYASYSSDASPYTEQTFDPLSTDASNNYGESWLYRSRGNRRGWRI